MKENLQKLMEEGFRYFRPYSANYELYKLGNEIVLFNFTEDRESHRYNLLHPFSKE